MSSSGHTSDDSSEMLASYELSPIPLATVCGPELRLSACNAAFQMMVRTHELLGLTVTEALPGTHAQRVHQQLYTVRTAGDRVHVREVRLDADEPGAGTSSYHDWIGIGFGDGNGELAGVRLTVLDVTERVEQRLARERERETIASQLRFNGTLGVVTEVQDALLPSAVPVLPRMDVAAHYLLAADDTAAGGDWFDAVVRPDGCLALVVGDVVGHGVTASAVMGQLRAVLHSQLMLVQDLEDAIDVVDRYARTIEEAWATTLCVVLLDPVSGRMEYSTCGHPPPLVLSQAGETRFLAPSGAGPLATSADRTVSTDFLAEQDLLLLYTDGLVERPGRSIQEGMVDLREVVARAARQGLQESHRRPAEHVCRLGLQILTRDTAVSHADDVTVLAAQRCAPMPPLELTLDARSTAATRARRSLGVDWLGPLEIDAVSDMVVRHAVGELVTNAVEHAYPAVGDGHDAEHDAVVEIHADLDKLGMLTCTIRDHGRWRGPDWSGRARGRGLRMVRGLVDELELHHDESGTTATFRHRLSRSATLMTRAGGPPPAASSDETFDVDVDDDRITVRGPVDATTAELFRSALRRATLSGDEDLRIDLAQVSHLGSVGVQVLHELVTRHRRVALVAPYGTVAQHVLDLVSLPYVNEDSEGYVG